MKRFRFSLRPVAILRTHQELRAREAFATAVQAFVRSEQALAATRERIQKLAEELNEGRAKSFSVSAEIRSLAAYRRDCLTEKEGERAVVEAKKTMDERRMEYVEAHRRLEVVNRLEEKARETHRYETMHEEQAEFDDFANRRFARRALKSA